MNMLPNLRWFHHLNRPEIAPPDWVFAPVWSVLYLLMGISFYLFIKSGATKEKFVPITFFLTQLALNIAWAPVFFGDRNMEAGLMIITLMWVFILLTIITFYKHSKVAAYLLIPYFLWVSFACILNYQYLILN